MLLEPPISELLKKVDNIYRLAVIVGKRAKYLQTVLTDEEREIKKEVTRAIDEVYSGKITG